MNFRRRSSNRDSLELNVTSMIDVLLILLIFFILTTTFSSETRLHVTLPQAAGEAAAQNQALEVAIDAQGRYFVAEHEVVNSTLESLKQALAQAAGEDRERPLIISADGKTPHQAVVTALDAASQLGLTHITFAAQAPQ